MSCCSSVSRSASTPVTPLACLQQGLQLRVAAGDGVREPGQPGQRRLDVGRGVGEVRRQHVRAPCVSCGGVDALDRRRPGPGRQARRRRAASVRETGMAVSGSSLPSPSGSSARYSAPTTVLIRIDALVRLAELHAVLDPEFDHDVVAVERDAGDRADLHAGDPDLVGLLEVGGLGEVRRGRSCRHR